MRSPRRSAGAGSPACTRWTPSRCPRGWAGCRPTRSSTATPSTSPTRPRRPGRGARPRRRPAAGRQPAFAIEDPDAPQNWPRCLTLWRANLLGSSAKGDEYFLKHLLGTHDNLMAELTPPDRRPRDVAWRDEDPPEGKLDLLLSLDFRMTSSTLLSDIVLPAATWYEKHDLNTTDMHPFVHAFSPAIDPPFESRTDFDAFHAIGRRFSELARTHLGVRRDVVAVPLQHDTPGETAQPGGRVLDWRAGEVRGRPGTHDAELRGCRAGLPGRRGEDGEHRAAGRAAGDDDQGGHLPPRRGDRLPVGEERRDARRCG